MLRAGYQGSVKVSVLTVNHVMDSLKGYKRRSGIPAGCKKYLGFSTADLCRLQDIPKDSEGGNS